MVASQSHAALLHLCCLCWLLSVSGSANSSLQLPSNSTFFRSKPNCRRKCGHLNIPYPFGIGSKCSINTGFSIYCNASIRRPFLQLLSQRRYYRVVNISTSHIRIRNPIFAQRCTKQRYIPINLTMDLSDSPFTLSQANAITQVGCADLTVLEGFVNHYGKQNDFALGCVSFCSANFSGNGSCPGNGCCQIPVPEGTVFLNATISSMPNHWENVVYNPCSHSFLGEKDSFTFHAVSELHEYKPGSPAPNWLRGRTVALNWRIGTSSCGEARRSGGSFACQNNSLCIDAPAGIGGYRCRCTPGYQGNPYLAPGCQDIDECKRNPCHVTGICTNTPGGYICGCPVGYHGYGQRNSSGCFPVTVPPSKLSNVSIGLISGMGFTTLLSVSFGLAKFTKKRENKKRRHKFFKQNGGLLLEQQTSVNEGILGNIRIFSAKELEIATDRFNESRILGRGGQGTVYKGMLSDGQLVAIKKSQLVDEHKSKHVVEQFINEVALLSQINHRNVVKLLGCCLETKVPLLVYEYVPNGTLYHLIHDDKNTEFLLSWTMRLKIATDVAGALAYLHSATSLPIFHRDIKSSNILLDEKYVAKVSDFGTSSKLVAVDQTHLTTNVNGTFGYIDPEYFQSNKFTEKSDVYSFGVVLVELLTGLKAIISSPDGEYENTSLVMRFLSSMNENKLDSILDDQVSGQGERECVVAVAKLAKRSLNLNGKKRPTMKEVAMELESLRFSQMGTRLTQDSSSHHKQGTKNLQTDDDDNNGWKATFDFPTNSFSDVFPLMFEEGIRQ
ncbi:hypothetical protein C2S53_006918 [Perilla frutescens var. hirtella]|uniref:Uncharacterized protein n=1 Tax=Perilla frutescens var. hirtella TaxID=608512 RepID=A0AAD4PA79_PERFH|nr:hypothetical protein C2S53_006918 [Perilla frutescens var. hirtella]